MSVRARNPATRRWMPEWSLPSVAAVLPLAGGALLGVSRTVRGGTTVAHEFLQTRALEARIERKLGGVERVISLRMNRQSCEQP